MILTATYTGKSNAKEQQKTSFFLIEKYKQTVCVGGKGYGRQRLGGVIFILYLHHVFYNSEPL